PASPSHADECCHLARGNQHLWRWRECLPLAAAFIEGLSSGSSLALQETASEAWRHVCSNPQSLQPEPHSSSSPRPCWQISEPPCRDRSTKWPTMRWLWDFRCDQTPPPPRRARAERGYVRRVRGLRSPEPL